MINTNTTLQEGHRGKTKRLEWTSSSDTASSGDFATRDTDVGDIHDHSSKMRVSTQ